MLMLLENSKQFQMHYSSVPGKQLLYDRRRTPEIVSSVLFFVETLMKHSKLTDKKKGKRPMGAMLNIVLHELEKQLNWFCGRPPQIATTRAK